MTINDSDIRRETDMGIDYLTTCGVCGQKFSTYTGLSHHLSQNHKDVTRKDYYDKFLKKPDDGKCVVCGLPTKFSDRLNRGYYTHCSKKCTANDTGTVTKRKATSLELYGSEGYNNHEQTSKTKLERYGDANYANGDQIKATKKARYGKEGYNNPEKRKATKLVKYGATNYVNTEKCAQTKLERYGSRTYNNSAKMQETKLARYNDPHYVNRDKGRETYIKNVILKYQSAAGDQCRIIGYENREFTCECTQCGNRFTIPVTTGYMRLFRYGINWCTVCHPAETSRSKEEGALFDYVSSLVGENNVVKSDRKTVFGHELDIYVPYKHLAIEFDGLYWHNELKKPDVYHLRKTEDCLEHGIHLVHVFEDEWNYQMDIVKSRISGLLGKNETIYARKCKIKDICQEEARAFLEDNHIQGSVVSKWRYGLYHNGQLVAVMTFGKNRFGEGIELLRFCTRKYLNIVGGASKLFKRFITDHQNIDTIISYADRRWSGGEAFYPKLGFVLDGKTRPSYYYIINNIRHNRLEFTKQNLVAAGFDPNLSEHEIMLSRKIYRIYDCGNYRYIWHR